MEDFDQIAAELEKSIKTDETVDLLKSDEAKAIMKDPARLKDALLAGIGVLAKAKGAMPTDLRQEEAVKDEEVTDDEEDPAEHPVKSGQGYKNTIPYKNKFGKGEDCEDEDEEDDDGDEDEAPKFFGKKAKKGSKKPMKKAQASGTDIGDVEDVTEFLGDMAKAVDDMGQRIYALQKGLTTMAKSITSLTEGSAIFGEVLHQVAANDPRRDNLAVNMAKAVAFLVGETKDLRKAVSEQKDLVKSIATMPGAPRVAGVALLKAEADANAAAGVPTATGAEISDGDRGRLFKAAVEHKITTSEYKNALKTGDTSVLLKAK